jgi:hypothetical protein
LYHPKIKKQNYLKISKRILYFKTTPLYLQIHFLLVILSSPDLSGRHEESHEQNTLLCDKTFLRVHNLIVFDHSFYILGLKN